ncbi:DivIVA domain-containing protein [Bifidobacterium sp. ESL0682]|uniref:DivIVA domain-containing protein n=1 Tax=Bifidobacterium sp. ESL0682 TaxID=2983212 RepID=UPI0023F6E4F4|nr:DivIVA domain-containing protein [Bifidobacterium sp. ESL0682]
MSILTAREVRDKAFQTVRFKEGYDVREVDDFLDEVAETLTQQEQRIAYLEGRVPGSLPINSGSSTGSSPSPWPSANSQAAQPVQLNDGEESEGGENGSSAQLSWDR